MTEPINKRYNVILEGIKKCDRNICLEMVSIGMNDNINNDVIKLIDACVANDDEWIRKAGALALYHVHFRLHDKIDHEMLLDLLSKFRNEKSPVVLGTIDSIINDIKLFNPTLLTKVRAIFHHEKGQMSH